MGFCVLKELDSFGQGPNISTTPITAMECWQCLPLSVVQLKGKHCRKPHCRNGIVDTFRQEDSSNGFVVNMSLPFNELPWSEISSRLVFHPDAHILFLTSHKAA